MRSSKSMAQVAAFVCIALALAIVTPQAAEAGAWTLKKNAVWTKLNFLSQSADEAYLTDGNMKLFGETAASTFQQRSFFFDVMYGVSDRVTLGLQVPYISNEFVFEANSSHPLASAPKDRVSESGIGDIRLMAKANLVDGPFVVTGKLVYKLPMGDFPTVPPEALSITEGQGDFDVILQVGRSLWPTPAYVNLDVGYRIRQGNDQAETNAAATDGQHYAFKIGNEILLNAEAGFTPSDMVAAAVKFEMLHGGDMGRRVTTLAPTLFIGKDIGLEVSYRMALSGQNYLKLSGFTAGITYSGGL